MSEEEDLSNADRAEQADRLFEGRHPVPESEWPQSVKTAVKIFKRYRTQKAYIPMMLVAEVGGLCLESLGNKDSVSRFLAFVADRRREVCLLTEGTMLLAKKENQQEALSYIGHLEDHPESEDVVFLSYECPEYSLSGVSKRQADGTWEDLVIERVPDTARQEGRFCGFFNKERDQRQ